MSRICLIKQPAGIGDIIYCQKIAHHYRSKGYEIIWPVLPEYSYIKEYLGEFSYPTIMDNFEYKNIYTDSSDNKTTGKEKFIFTDEFIFLPFESYVGNGLYLEEKYSVVNLQMNDWANYVGLMRNFKKEQELFNLKNSNNEEYVLVNYNYGTRPTTRRIKYDYNSKGMKVIEMDFIHGYTYFDWCKLVEEASDVCFSCCATTLLVEILQPKKVLNPTIMMHSIESRPVVECLYNNVKWNYVIGN